MAADNRNTEVGVADMVNHNKADTVVRNSHKVDLYGRWLWRRTTAIRRWGWRIWSTTTRRIRWSATATRWICMGGGYGGGQPQYGGGGGGYGQPQQGGYGGPQQPQGGFVWAVAMAADNRNTEVGVADMVNHNKA